MTLIELMVVVIILSVLTTLGISGYQKLIYQARNTEAYEFLGVIRGAQHSNYETFGAYAGANQWVEWPPGPYPLERATNWGDPPQGSLWQQLGIRPGGPVWFKYRMRADTDPQRAPGEVFRVAPNGPWFQAQARGDFDGDGELSLFEITSSGARIFVANRNE